MLKKQRKCCVWHRLICWDCDGEVFTDFGGNGSVRKVRELTQNICIFWLPNSQDIRTCIHAEEYSTQRPQTSPSRRFPFIQFEHTIKINSRGRITYENMSMGYCSFLSLVRHPTGAIVPKNIVPRDRSRGRRKSDLNLFISKFSSLTDCTLIHWPSQFKSTGLIDGSASIRKNTSSYICTGNDPGLTRSQWDPGTELAVKLCGLGKIEEFFNPEILT